MIRTVPLLLTTTALVGSLACTNSADTNVFSSPGNRQIKPNATEAALFSGNSLGATSAAPTKAAAVTYRIFVTTHSGDPVCHGTAQINIMTNFSMQFPEAQITCLNFTIDLAGILGSSFATNSPGLSNLSSDGKMLYIKQIANAEFDPPRPFILGPIVQDASVYRGYKLTVPESITVNDPTSHLQKTGQGQFDVVVNGIGLNYSNTLSPKNNFSNVMDWQIGASGFDGIPTKDGLLIKKMEWWWNVEPVMIPKLEITGDLGGFIGSTGGSSAVSQLIGEVTISLSVQDYDFGN